MTKKKNLFSDILHRSALARSICWVILVFIVLIITFVFSKDATKKPVLYSIAPSVASPGDIVVLTGANFGTNRLNSYVEIAGSRITNSGYRDWSDSSITIMLPSNIQDGLVFVGTSLGRSEPLFFANKHEIPSAVKQGIGKLLPVITSISPLSGCVGDIITIRGVNFGSIRRDSCVVFNTDRALDSSLDNKIKASYKNYDYESWTDTEIKVRIPDGASSGSVQVQTKNGSSLSQSLEVNYPVGKKTFTGQKTYILQETIDLQNKTPNIPLELMLFVPKPQEVLNQHISVKSVSPSPLITNNDFDIIQTLTPVEEKQRLSQEYEVVLYSYNSDINANSVKRYTNKSANLQVLYTTADECVPSDEQSIQDLSLSITKGYINPYQKARLIYDYMIDNYKLLNLVRADKEAALDLLDTKAGDAYDFAIIYTALCRASNIPSLPVAGLLVEGGYTTKAHWWAEVYFEDYGWFPVDVALSAGVNYKESEGASDASGEKMLALRDFYFGSMDTRHIAFSRGFKQVKTSTSESACTTKQRSFALQSIWEECSNPNSSYSSLWNVPIILAVE